MDIKKFKKSINKKIINIRRKFGYLPEISRPYKEPKSTYKKLICVTGFFYSGSGAVVDLLREFNNITAICRPDKESGTQLKKSQQQEVDFFRDYSGVLDLESAFEAFYPYVQDLKLKSFITISEYHYRKGGIYTDKFMQLTWNFINELVEYKKTIPHVPAGGKAFTVKEGFLLNFKNLASPFVFKPENGNIVYFLKNLSVKEYREIAKKYVTSVLKTINSKEILLLDQMLSNGCTDINKLEDYLGKFKNIAVYRDPRDVYTQGIQNNLKFLPHEVEIFAKWYKNYVEPYKNLQHEDFLLLRFEDLILDFENTKKRILEFANIDESHHTKPKSCLQTEVSRQNIGLYKTFEDQDAIKYIEENLSEYCYNQD